MWVLAAAATVAALTGSVSPVYGGWVTPKVSPVSARVELATRCDHSAAWVGVSGPTSTGGDWLQAGVAYQDGRSRMYAERGIHGVRTIVWGRDATSADVRVVRRGESWVAEANGKPVLALPAASSWLTMTSTLGESDDGCGMFRATFTRRVQPGGRRWQAGLAVTGADVSVG